MNEEEELEVKEPTAEEQMRRMSRRSFMWAGASVLGAYGILRWINTSQKIDGTVAPLRKALEFNEGVVSALYSPQRLSPEFAPSQVTFLKVNGKLGLDSPLDLDQWNLEAPNGETIDLARIRSLPRTEMITEHKCVEGWSSVVRWAGTRFSEFAKLYPPSEGMTQVSLATPDGGYYVSVDIPAMMHPQTLLCYEMNGEPLTEEHGAPLRLVVPHKYGVKSIKRIGSIAYTKEHAPDYWGEQGYDWYIEL